MLHAGIAILKDMAVWEKIGRILQPLEHSLASYYGISLPSEEALPTSESDSECKMELCKEWTEPTNTMIKRVCPVCSRSVPAPDGDHRQCVLELFKTNRIQSVKDWEKMSIVRRKIVVPASEVMKNQSSTL